MLEVIAACNLGKINDTNLGKALADSFINFDWNGYNEAIGYYENKCLNGMLSYNYSKEANIAEIANIYIVPESRNKGIGKKLIYNAIAKYPDKLWLYQAGATNEASIKLALSCGFSIIGAVLWIE